jgi:hypothetical protein
MLFTEIQTKLLVKLAQRRRDLRLAPSSQRPPGSAH